MYTLLGNLFTILKCLSLFITFYSALQHFSEISQFRNGNSGITQSFQMTEFESNGIMINTTIQRSVPQVKMIRLSLWWTYLFHFGFESFFSSSKHALIVTFLTLIDTEFLKWTIFITSHVYWHVDSEYEKHLNFFNLTFHCLWRTQEINWC